MIAQSPVGPRGKDVAVDDSYANLILLCPTHHTEIDKAPEGVYTVALLQTWKSEHENEVANSLKSPHFDSKKLFADYVDRLLIENKSCWSQYGPESAEANENPLSNLSQIWQLRKLALVVPNNRRIINAIRMNWSIIERPDAAIFSRFIEHAEGFERNCYYRTEGVARFPVEFAEVVERYVQS